MSQQNLFTFAFWRKGKLHIWLLYTVEERLCWYTLVRFTKGLCSYKTLHLFI